MSVLLTTAYAAGLDARRSIFLGAEATLALLDHAPPGARGYVLLVNVESGWNLTGGDIGEAALLEIAESETVTEELIRQAVEGAFAFNGEVWKIDENGFAAPVGVAKRIWRFRVVPTGEPFIAAADSEG